MNKNYHKRFTYLFFAEIYSICSLSKIETWPKAWSCISSLAIWEWLWSKSFRRLSCYKYQNISKVIFYHVPPPKNNTKLSTTVDQIFKMELILNLLECHSNWVSLVVFMDSMDFLSKSTSRQIKHEFNF